MKKFTLAVFAAISFAGSVLAQPTFSVVAPPDNNSTSQFRAPNGTSGHAFMHAVFLVKQSELTPMALANITKFGFKMNSGTASVPVTGNFTVYLQNTTDATYQKGTNYATALTGMTQVYASTLTVPVSAGPTTNTITLSTPFNYNGGGIYVAYEWSSTGPFDNTMAVYACNNTMNTGSGGGGSADAASPGPAPATLTLTAFRPCYIFEATNTATTELAVLDATVSGKMAKTFNASQTISAKILNSSIGTQTNIAVTLNVTGANTFNNVQTISSLAAGASTIVTFAPYSPVVQGLSSCIISLGGDQILTNNSIAKSQSITCSTFANNPAVGSYTAGVGFGAGSGIICNRMTIPTTSDLRAVRLGISSNTTAVGNSVYGALLDASGAVLAVTNTLIIGNTMLNTFQELTFTSLQNIASGTDFHLGLAQVANATAYYPVGGLATSAPPDGYYTTPIAGGSLTPITNLSYYYGIEAVFTSTNPVLTVTPSKSVICKGEPVTLTASGGASYVWNNNVTTAAVVVSPTITTGYTVTGTDANGCVNSKTYTQTVAPCLGLTANANDGQDILLFPNPAVNGKTTVSGLEGTNTVSLYNVLGQLVSTQIVTSESVEINLNNQPSGNYLIKITNNYNQTKTLKFLNQN
jgi:hypothetical protein